MSTTTKLHEGRWASTIQGNKQREHNAKEEEKEVVGVVEDEKQEEEKDPFVVNRWPRTRNRR